MLGVKLEDQQAIDRAAETLSVPSVAFAEQGSRDLGSTMATWKAVPTRPTIGANSRTVPALAS